MTTPKTEPVTYDVPVLDDEQQTEIHVARFAGLSSVGVGQTVTIEAWGLDGDDKAVHVPVVARVEQAEAHALAILGACQRVRRYQVKNHPAPASVDALAMRCFACGSHGRRADAEADVPPGWRMFTDPEPPRRTRFPACEACAPTILGAGYLTPAPAEAPAPRLATCACGAQAPCDTTGTPTPPGWYMLWRPVVGPFPGTYDAAWACCEAGVRAYERDGFRRTPENPKPAGGTPQPGPHKARMQCYVCPTTAPYEPPGQDMPPHWQRVEWPQPEEARAQGIAPGYVFVCSDLCAAKVRATKAGDRA